MMFLVSRQNWVGRRLRFFKYISDVVKRVLEFFTSFKA